MKFFFGGFIKKVPGGKDIVKVHYSPEALAQAVDLALIDCSKQRKTEKLIDRLFILWSERTKHILSGSEVPAEIDIEIANIKTWLIDFKNL